VTAFIKTLTQPDASGKKRKLPDAPTPSGKKVLARRYLFVSIHLYPFNCLSIGLDLYLTSYKYMSVPNSLDMDITETLLP